MCNMLIIQTVNEAIIYTNHAFKGLMEMQKNTAPKLPQTITKFIFIKMRSIPMAKLSKRPPIVQPQSLCYCVCFLSIYPYHSGNSTSSTHLTRV